MQKPRNGLAVMRVSSIKQGIQGDSPETQRKQIQRFAAARNIRIRESFTFLESASKDFQPIQMAIDYCKDPANKIDVLLIKAIDRFTRGGVAAYLQLKAQLESYGVELIDLHGIISTHKVNTLEHFGVSYRWSVYSPTKNAEILEAERGRDEIRDISTRLIGSEIHYTREGYWMRRPPFGYTSHKTETRNGKRSVLIPNQPEAYLIAKMFELRARGTMDDRQIVEEVNRLGYKSREDLIRSKTDRTVVTGIRGGKPLTLKRFWRYISNPLYAGVNNEKWTNGVPVVCKFEGLVDIETFNKANRGKMTIAAERGRVAVYQIKSDYSLKKTVAPNPNYPYKRVVMCPHCERPLLGSASRGRLGKHYAAYHCTHRGHNFRVPKKIFDGAILSFTKSLQLKSDHSKRAMQAAKLEYDDRLRLNQQDDNHVDFKLAELKAELEAHIYRIKMVSSAIVIKSLEVDIARIEKEIAQLETERPKAKTNHLTRKVIDTYAAYYLSHLDELLLNQPELAAKAAGFGILFDRAPTYPELLPSSDIADQSTLHPMFTIRST